MDRGSLRSGLDLVEFGDMTGSYPAAYARPPHLQVSSASQYLDYRLLSTSLSTIAQPTIETQSHLPTHSSAFVMNPKSTTLEKVQHTEDFQAGLSQAASARPAMDQPDIQASLLQYQGHPGPECGLPSVSAPFTMVTQPTIERQPAPYQHTLPFSPSANWPLNTFVPPNSLPTLFLPQPLPAPPASFAPPLVDFCTKLCDDPLPLATVPAPSNIAATHRNNNEPTMYEFVWALDDREDAALPQNSFCGTNVIPVGVHNLDLIQTDQFMNKKGHTAVSSGRIRSNPISWASDDSKTKKREYSQLVKKKLMEQMFTEDAAPTKCDATYAAIQAETAIEIFGCQTVLVDLLTPIMDMASSIRKAFKTQANETVDKLFDLEPPLHSTEDFVAYRAERVNALLSIENYGCFHTTTDNVGDDR